MQDSPSQQAVLLFVYNADTGMFNTLADIGHKIFSPQTYQCDLCMLTHGYFRERTAWRTFIEELPLEARFLHRDQFHSSHPGIDTPLPAVFLQRGEELKLCITARSLHDCSNLDDLKNLLALACMQGNA